MSVLPTFTTRRTQASRSRHDRGDPNTMILLVASRCHSPCSGSALQFTSRKLEPVSRRSAQVGASCELFVFVTNLDGYFVYFRRYQSSARVQPVLWPSMSSPSVPTTPADVVEGMSVFAHSSPSTMFPSSLRNVRRPPQEVPCRPRSGIARWRRAGSAATSASTVSSC